MCTNKTTFTTRKKNEENLSFSYHRTIVNRLSSELTRVTREIILEKDVLTDFQTKLDAAE